MSKPAALELAICAAASSWHVAGDRNLPIVERGSWDGNAAGKALLDAAHIGGDKPNHELARRGFVFCDTANPDERGSYKDPFAVIVDGELKASSAGIRALESFVPRTDVPESVKSSGNALVAHYKSKLQGDAKSTAALAFNACAQALSAGDQPPEWVQLFTGAKVTPQDGRQPWKLDNLAAVIAASKLPALIDYDHASVREVADGKNSAAAGWIVSLSAKGPNGESGLWAKVEWQPEGANAITSKKFRYISPTFLHDKTTREIRAIAGAGLTNTPALDLPALASTQQGASSVDELMTKLRAALNLPDTASADDVVQAITAMRNNSNALCTAAGVTTLGANETAAICVRLKSPAVDPDTQKQLDDLQKQVATLTAAARGATAAVEVEKAIAAGKITPATKTWALDYATREPEGFAGFIKAAPTILSTGRIAETPPADGALTETERALCAQMKVTPEEFKAEKARLATVH